nr:MAG TPA: N-6 DNA Methylase [Caudoviricetes sp.]
MKNLDKGTYRVSRYEFLSDVFECGAIAISNRFDKIHAKKREEEYVRIVKKYDSDIQKLLCETFGMIFVLLTHQLDVGFSDYLGEIYMSSGTSSDRAGQFFTPYHVSKVCAEMAMSKDIVEQHIENDDVLKLNEPACGSGGMIIAAADILYNKYNFNFSRNLFVVCGDIDKRCVHMAYLQLALAGIPAIILHQDALTLETWDRWETPAYIMQYLRFRNGVKNNGT